MIFNVSMRRFLHFCVPGKAEVYLYFVCLTVRRLEVKLCREQERHLCTMFLDEL